MKGANSFSSATGAKVGNREKIKFTYPQLGAVKGAQLGDYERNLHPK